MKKTEEYLTTKEVAEFIGSCPGQSATWSCGDLSLPQAKKVWPVGVCSV